jgi:hypothetical protein
MPTFSYLAGGAGCGKTFLARALAKQWGGELVATTGIAAINLGGTTINALLRFFDTKSLFEAYTAGFLTATLGRLWRAGMKRLVLDEVSMLDGDQLTYLVRAIEEVNGRGFVVDSKWEDDETAPELGLTLVGDFAQLPPVKAPFAFESPEWEKFHLTTHTLTEIRRQSDPDFILALRAARRGDGKTALEYFADRLQTETDEHFDGPTILAKNESVDRYNQLRMDKLTGKAISFTSTRWGKQRSEWGNPEKPKITWGIPETLQLKAGALVMILANKRENLLITGRSNFIYVNGDLGTLVDAGDHSATVVLHRTGEEVTVEYVHRTVTIPLDSARRKELVANGQEHLIENKKWEILGTIDYMPLRLAYASTVHKIQGLSLDKVQVNIRDSFFRQPGMIYVALSRARIASGLRVVGSTAAFHERCTSDKKVLPWL